MRQITLLESIEVTGAALSIQGTSIDIPNNFDIPHHEFVIIEQTFQKVLDNEINFYQAASFLKEQHICKYDVTHYFNSVVLKAGNSNS
jgi:hypothetical protein